MACEVPGGKPIRGMIIFLLAEWTGLCQVLEGGEGRSVMWHREVWHQILSEKRTKAPLGKRALCKVCTDGTDTVLTFLQGLGRRTDPLEGRFTSDSPVRRLEFTGKHISPFSVGPRVEMPT